MPDQPLPTFKMEVTASSIVTISGRDLYVSQELVAGVVDLSGVIDPSNRRTMIWAVNGIAQNYLAFRAPETPFLRGGEAKDALARLRSPVAKIAKTLGSLAPEQRALLDAILRPSADDPSNAGLLKLEGSLRNLADGINELKQTYKPRAGRPAFVLVEYTVALLMGMFEVLTSQRATVSMTKDGEHTPRASSPQAEAIIMLMTGIDPALQAGTVIKKIKKLNRGPAARRRQPFLLWASFKTATVKPIPANAEDLIG